MKQRHSSFEICTELQKAIIQGFTFDFIIGLDGNYYCCPQYDEPCNVEIVSIISVVDFPIIACIYLVKSSENLKGTVIEYHDY
jgi:hypothetical protein